MTETIAQAKKSLREALEKYQKQLVANLGQARARIEDGDVLVLEWDLPPVPEELIPKKMRTAQPRIVGSVDLPKPKTKVIHLLHEGRALCGRQDAPGDWPVGHQWVPFVEFVNGKLGKTAERAKPHLCPRCLATAEHLKRQFLCQGTGDVAETGPALEAIGMGHCRKCRQTVPLDPNIEKPTLGEHVHLGGARG